MGWPHQVHESVVSLVCQTDKANPMELRFQRSVENLEYRMGMANPMEEYIWELRVKDWVVARAGQKLQVLLIPAQSCLVIETAIATALRFPQEPGPNVLVKFPTFRVRLRWPSALGETGLHALAKFRPGRDYRCLTLIRLAAVSASLALNYSGVE